MKRSVASFLILTLIMTSLLMLTFNIRQVKALEPPEIEWSTTYGGSQRDIAFSLVQTSDGGYALAGWTESYGSGSCDVWLVKVDTTGSLQWNKTFGGWSADETFSVVETMDGGYALAGRRSVGTGSWDFYLVKTDSGGNLEWSTPYGGANDDSSYSVVQTSDGGYALAGATDSIDVGYDFYLVKIDSFGDFEWSKTYGGTNNEMARCVVQTSDGGYALTGYTDSYGSNGRDAWLVKTDSSGNVQWNRTYGGASTDHANSVVETSDGGYALAGCTFSFYPWGFWLVKTDPSGNAQWNKTYGGGNIGAYSLVQTEDSGYALAGTVIDVGARLVKTDATGIMQWSKTFGGPGVDGGQSVVQTNDGGFALTGYTSSYGAGDWDFLLIKVAEPPKYLISIVSPENKTYSVKDVLLTFTISEPASWMGYSLDGQLNVTVAGNTTLSGLLDGSHYVVVYANDTAGKMWTSNTVYFTVDTAPSPPPPPSTPTYFMLTQGNRLWFVVPVQNAESVTEFYDYYGSSGHTPFMESHVGKIYLYHDTQSDALSLILHQGIDDDTPGTMESLFDFEDVPEGAFVSVSDEPRGLGGSPRSPSLAEFDLALEPEAHWGNTHNSDGGVLSGLSMDEPWNMTIIPTFISGVQAWRYVHSNGTEIALTMDEPITIGLHTRAITILSPQNKSYADTSVPLTFTVNETASWMGYSLDGQANVTVAGNTTLTSLLEGSHGVVVYASNTAGKMWTSNTVYFTIETKKEEPPPAWFPAWIIVMTVITIVVVAALPTAIEAMKRKKI